MSQPDEPRRPRPKNPGDPTKASRPKAAPTDTDTESVWRRPTEPDEEFTRPRKKTSREPAPATGGPKMIERILFGKVSTSHLASFCRQFATYSDAGVDLIKSLAALEKQFSRTAIGPILGRLILRVRQGDALSDAMEREPQAFDNLFLNMIRVAEARGGIPETMRGLADHYDARVRLIRQARSAMIYPIIVMIVAAGVIALMSIFLLPMFASLLEELTRGKGGVANLPLPSRVLMGLSKFVAAAGWWLVPLLTVSSIVGLFQLYKTRTGKAAMDEAGLYIPVFGKFLRLLETARFTRTLAALLNAGVDMASSLDLTSNVLRLTPYRRAIQGTKAEVINGAELSEALTDTQRFSDDVIAIVNSGEETGNLPESLDKLADDYEERVTYMVKNLGSLVQPLIMIVLGGVVLFIILAVILPYIAVLSSLGGG
jgi:type IV pilus assembly protein PilC